MTKKIGKYACIYDLKVFKYDPKGQKYDLII